jgi:hypothetical protein
MRDHNNYRRRRSAAFRFRTPPPNARKKNPQRVISSILYIERSGQSTSLRFATEAHEDQWKLALPALPSWPACWRWPPTKPNIRRDQEGDHHHVPNVDKGVFA